MTNASIQVRMNENKHIIRQIVRAVLIFNRVFYVALGRDRLQVT